MILLCQLFTPILTSGGRIWRMHQSDGLCWFRHFSQICQHARLHRLDDLHKEDMKVFKSIEILDEVTVEDSGESWLGIVRATPPIC